MTTIVCTNQSELEAACEAQRLDASVRILIREWTGSSHAVLRGSSSAELRGSSHAALRGSSSAALWGSSSAVLCGSSRAVLRGSSHAVLYGSSRAELRDSSRAELYGSSHAVLRGSSHAELWGSSRAELRDSSHAVLRGSSRAELYGSSRAELYGSSHAELYGSSRAVLWDSSHAELYGSSRAVLWDSSRADASARAAIHLMSKHATVNGGVVIDCTEPITTIEAACDEWMLTPKRGRITVYKAVNDKLESERGFAYPIGGSVKAPDWDPSTKCGGGLHFSPTPSAAKKYYRQATRFLECSVLVRDAALCDVDVFPDKLKARAAKVIREVDQWGEPVEETK